MVYTAAGRVWRSPENQPILVQLAECCLHLREGNENLVAPACVVLCLVPVLHWLRLPGPQPWRVSSIYHGHSSVSFHVPDTSL